MNRTGTNKEINSCWYLFIDLLNNMDVWAFECIGRRIIIFKYMITDSFYGNTFYTW